MKLRNIMIGSAFVFTALSLTACASHNTNTTTPATTGRPTQATYPLTPTHRVPPLYPPMAAYYGVQGDAILCFTVEANGDPGGDIHVSKTNFWTTSGKPPNPDAENALKKAAIETIKWWKFVPRRRNGKPVSTPKTCQTLKFRLHMRPNVRH